MPLAAPLPLVRSLLALVAAWLVATVDDPAFAASGMFGPQTLSGVADFRLTAVDGERSWTDGGFGKLRIGGTKDANLNVRPVATEAILIWQPRFSWSVTGTVAVAAQHEQDNAIDLVEAFISVKPLPSGSTRISGRTGLFWPQISLEHEGAAWTVADMITPSAINSWIGEEVKVIGAEASIEHALGTGRVTATAGLFGFNDTSGTLLAFRGWALHDKKATGFGLEPLPPLNPFMTDVQASRTRPLIEIDARPGYYGRIEAQLAAPVEIAGFYYDNRGDPEAVTAELQWGWRTRFWNFGARIEPVPATRILAQAMIGTTEMGIENSDGYWVDTRFHSAFLRVSHEVGRSTLSGRIELFGTRERGRKMVRSKSEEGWAATAAISRILSPNIRMIGEVTHVSSERGERTRLNLRPKQHQTLVQLAARLAF